MSISRSCLIVGAGMSGLTAACALRELDYRVVLLDKSRGPGGRMATRRVGPGRFDHGAQFFTVRDARFQEAVDGWQSHGWVTPWFSEGGHVRYRGVAGMNGIAKELAKHLEVRTETTVEHIETAGSHWRVLSSDGERFEAETLLLTAPVPQSLKLLSSQLSRMPDEMTGILHGIDYEPCFALLANLDKPSLVPPPGYVRPDFGDIAFIADNTKKGISAAPAALTVHASSGFTRKWFDAPQEQVAHLLLDAAQPWLGSEVMDWQVHRWRYSQPISTTPEHCLYSRTPAPIAFAGDAFSGPRIEGAFLSGLAAAGCIASGREK